MKWIARKRMHVNRTATAWLIRHFLDPGAAFIYDSLYSHIRGAISEGRLTLAGWRSPRS